jgi:hypothetical protein
MRQERTVQCDRAAAAGRWSTRGSRLTRLTAAQRRIAAYDDLLARFGNATELPLRERVTRALVNKGITLGALDRSTEAIAVYDDVLARFDDATEPGLREQVEEAKRLRAAADVTAREGGRRLTAIGGP